MKKHKGFSLTGFTLLETLIAISILTLSISGPLMSASRAIVLAEVSRDQLTASYLAQEGIEYVRAMRDDAYLHSYSGADASTVAWDDFISGADQWSITQCISVACTLDPTLTMGFGSSLAAYSGNAPLYLTSATDGIYRQQQTGTKTPFTRTIQATAISPTEEAVTSTVSWSFHNTMHSVTIVDHLTPWQ